MLDYSVRSFQYFVRSFHYFVSPFDYLVSPFYYYFFVRSLDYFVSPFHYFVCPFHYFVCPFQYLVFSITVLYHSIILLVQSRPAMIPPPIQFPFNRLPVSSFKTMYISLSAHTASLLCWRVKAESQYSWLRSKKRSTVANEARMELS